MSLMSIVKVAAIVAISVRYIDHREQPSLELVECASRGRMALLQFAAVTVWNFEWL